MTIDLTREEDVDWFSELRSTEKQEDNDTNWVPYIGPRGGSGWQSVDNGSVTYDDDPPGNKVGEELQEADKEDIVDAIDDVFGTDVAEDLDEYTVERDDLLQEIQEVATPEELADVANAVEVDDEFVEDAPIDDVTLLEDIQSEFNNIGDESEEQEEESTDETSEEERSDLFQERIEQLPMPSEPKEPSEGDGIKPDASAWDDIDRDDIDSVSDAQETLTEGEMLGIGLDISEETDDLPFSENTDIPVYDNSKYPSIDVAVDTEDFSNLQAQIHEEYYDTERENHFGTADPQRVDEYAEIIESDDDSMPRPYVVLDRDGDVASYQEGRHRALAAIQANEEDVPVRFVVDNSKDVK